MDMKTTKIDEYLKKPYSRILTPCEESGFTAEILEFPGCFAEGETAGKAYEALERAAKSWIEAAREQGQEIPEPINNQGYGGKIALRLPRSIHRQAVRMAERDETSLNQFLLGAISTRIGAEDFCNNLIERLRSGFFHQTFNITATLNVDKITIKPDQTVAFNDNSLLDEIKLDTKLNTEGSING